MSGDKERFVAFDSNILTYFLEANSGNYRLAPDDSIADQRVAAMRLFLHCGPEIMPTVRAEALRIDNAQRLEEHIRFIDGNFGEFIPDDQQQQSIQRRAAELLPFHPKGENDCRILAEVEEDGDVPVLVTWDGGFRNDLRGRTRIRVESPTDCWNGFDIPRGTAPKWTPGAGHPLASQDWWRWE